MATVTIREAIHKRIEKGETDDQKVIKAVSKQLDVREDSVRNMLAKIRKDEKPGGHSLTEFKDKYDKSTIIPRKIKAALKELGAAWEYQYEFVKRAGVSHIDMNAFHDMFADHIVTLKGESKKIWCGTVSFAKQLKELNI